jgi:hypothetical protein
LPQNGFGSEDVRETDDAVAAGELVKKEVETFVKRTSSATNERGKPFPT